MHILLNILLFLCSYYNVFAFNVQVSESGPEKIIYNLDKAKELFEEFIETFDKKYENDIEYAHRLKIFTEHLKDSNKRNNNNGTEIYGITKYMDITAEEFERYNSLKWDPALEDSIEEYVEYDVPPPPDSWDWRTKGVVTPAKDQKLCGTCWAFSVAGCVEGQHAIKHKTLYNLSEQLLVDCYHEGNRCTEGDYPHLAFLRAKSGGFMKETDYPYEDDAGKCRLDKDKVVARVGGGSRVFIKNEEQLKKLVYNYGPVVIGISISLHGWFKYRGGIATSEGLSCPTAGFPSHAVLVVGYGTEKGVPYWIIKNSQGLDWGERGFLRLIRGKKACLILVYAAKADII